MSTIEQSATDAPHFVIENFEHGVIFRINRPHKLNAITKEIKRGLDQCLTDAETRGLRAIIITGTGERAFCAGTDLAEWPTMPVEERAASSDMARDFLFRLSGAKPVSIAAMNGLAFGGGLELAMGCTFRVAASHVRVALPEIKLGLIPAYAGTQYLTALVGRARALEMMLTGKPVGAGEALAMGLVNRLVPEGSSALDGALALAAEVCTHSPVAIAAVRAAVDAAGPQVTRAGLDFEGEQVRRVARSDDAREGVTAFLEKRPARFIGR
jgi:enoyl-CoA hydratase